MGRIYGMEILFDNVPKVSPRLSIVLLDWSCRESFHVLDYLADQTVEREQYELIWIEYYDRRAEEIDKKIEQCALAGKPPPLGPMGKIADAQRCLLPQAFNVQRRNRS